MYFQEWQQLPSKQPNPAPTGFSITRFENDVDAPSTNYQKIDRKASRIMRLRCARSGRRRLIRFESVPNLPLGPIQLFSVLIISRKPDTVAICVPFCARIESLPASLSPKNNEEKHTCLIKLQHSRARICPLTCAYGLSNAPGMQHMPTNR